MGTDQSASQPTFAERVQNGDGDADALGGGQLICAGSLDLMIGVVDVGGGNGALMAEILKAYPQPVGIVFDLPRVAAAAQQTIDAGGLGDRCRFTAGDAFEKVPGGADAYVLSNFLVSWADDQAVILLRNCRKAIAENGKVLLIEWVMPAGNEPRERFRFFDTVSTDLIMLSVNGSGGGRVRTRSGFQDLLVTVGFELTAVIPTRAPSMLSKQGPHRPTRLPSPAENADPDHQIGSFRRGDL